MDWISLLVIAVALAMDAFTVAMVTGFTLCRLSKRQMFRLSFHFGLFQALMPTIGWFLGRAVHAYIAALDHWIALGLLSFVGGKMIYEAVNNGDDQSITNDPTRGWTLVLLSVATSIDALAVGLTLGVLGETILIPVLVIGVVAALLTLVGMQIGCRIGTFWRKGVEVFGGILLIGIGIKIVLEHLFFM